jgi:hypothetical protein
MPFGEIIHEQHRSLTLPQTHHGCKQLQKGNSLIIGSN